MGTTNGFWSESQTSEQECESHFISMLNFVSILRLCLFYLKAFTSNIPSSYEEYLVVTDCHHTMLRKVNRKLMPTVVLTSYFCCLKNSVSITSFGDKKFFSKFCSGCSSSLLYHQLLFLPVFTTELQL